METTKSSGEQTQILFKLSKKLKDEFAAMCKEREMDMTNTLRDLISTSVRNYKRQNSKTSSNV